VNTFPFLSISTKIEYWWMFKVLGVLKWVSQTKEMGRPTGAIGQPKVGTLDKTTSSVALKLAMVNVSKGAIVCCTFYCYNYFLEMS